MIDWRFLGGLVALLALAGWAAWPLVDGLAGGPAGLLAGLAFSLASLALGFHGLRWGAARGQRHFMGAILGGFLGRVLALGVFALLLATVADAHLTVALLTVVAAHLVFGMAEIVYLQRTDALG